MTCAQITKQLGGQHQKMIKMRATSVKLVGLGKAKRMGLVNHSGLLFESRQPFECEGGQLRTRMEAL